MQLKHILFITGIACVVGFTWPTFWARNDETIGSNAWLKKEISLLQPKASGKLDPAVLRLSLKAYAKARKKGMDNKELLTIIDYSKPSTEKRLWVFDLKRHRQVLNTWVSHGSGSGGLKATSFSNQTGSHKSSIGVFITTDETYFGGNGYSLKLRGLEQGINDNAYNRDIVVHGAWYASGTTVLKYGQAGRSWGCPAVGPDQAKPLIDTIKGNTLLFAYYPDKHWLKTSSFLA